MALSSKSVPRFTYQTGPGCQQGAVWYVICISNALSSQKVSHDLHIKRALVQRIVADLIQRAHWICNLHIICVVQKHNSRVVCNLHIKRALVQRILADLIQRARVICNLHIKHALSKNTTAERLGALGSRLVESQGVWG